MINPSNQLNELNKQIDEKTKKVEICLSIENIDDAWLAQSELNDLHRQWERILTEWLATDARLMG